ncbi:MAG: FadR family transcriptional regulator [Deltaproteobacteria bacterium]|nr:FadR family transcriptional regulator [Deltaproteobacteria bacterium]
MPIRKRKTTTPPSSTNAVFDELLSGIVSGRYPAGTRLPAERELSAQLGASRATLREALRRLEQWSLIAPRRGSGIVVRDVATDATVDVLPAYVKAGAGGGPATARLIVDLLSLRRALVVEIVRLVGNRCPPGSLAGARTALERAWAVRHDRDQFVREDFTLMLGVVAGARFLPGVWMLNSLRTVYVELATTFSHATHNAPPESYRGAYHAAFDALEAGDSLTAARHIDDYLGEHDRKMCHALGLEFEPDTRTGGN